VNIAWIDELPRWAIPAQRFLAFDVDLDASGDVKPGRFKANVESTSAREKRNNRPARTPNSVLLSRHVAFRSPRATLSSMAHRFPPFYWPMGIVNGGGNKAARRASCRKEGPAMTAVPRITNDKR
jgi:hypothetical protein